MDVVHSDVVLVKIVGPLSSANAREFSAICKIKQSVSYPEVSHAREQTSPRPRTRLLAVTACLLSAVRPSSLMSGSLISVK